MADPIRGEVWLGDLGPTRGHEQSGKRPLLIFSVDAFIDATCARAKMEMT